jgi:hypothetical protein
MLSRETGTDSPDLHSFQWRRRSLSFTSLDWFKICIAVGRSNRPAHCVGVISDDPMEEYMNVTKVLGLAAVGALLMLVAPAKRAQALSLTSPGAAAATQDGKQMTTEVGWHHHHHHHHHHR